MAILVARGLLVLSLGFMEHCRLRLSWKSVKVSANIDWLGQSEQSGCIHNCSQFLLSRGCFIVTQRPKLLPVLMVCFSFV